MSLERVRVILTLDYDAGKLPHRFNWAQTAAFFVARTPFKLVKVEVELPLDKPAGQV